jgi:nitrous oxide reductase accessory protein NosL
MHHHTRTKARMRSDRARPHRDDHTARFVAGDEGGNLARWSTVPMQIASAHSGSLDFQDNFSDSGCRIRKRSKFESTVTTKDNTAHVPISYSVLIHQSQTAQANTR